MPVCCLTQPVPSVQGERCLPKAFPPERRRGPLSQLPSSAAGLWWPRRPFAGRCHQPGTATALRRAPPALSIPARAAPPGNGHQSHTSALGMIPMMGASPSQPCQFPLVGPTDWLTDWLTALAPAQEGVHGQDSACCSCSSRYYVLLWLEMPVGLSLTLQAIWIALGQHFHWGNGEKINRFLLLESFFLSTEHGQLQGLRAEEMKASCNVYFLSLLKWTITKNKAKSKTKKLSKCQC